MNKDRISFEIGKMIFLSYTQSIHAEAYECTINLVNELKDSLILTSVINGIKDLWKDYEFSEITTKDIEEMLIHFNLNFTFDI